MQMLRDNSHGVGTAVDLYGLGSRPSGVIGCSVLLCRSFPGALEKKQRLVFKDIPYL